MVAVAGIGVEQGGQRGEGAAFGVGAQRTHGEFRRIRVGVGDGVQCVPVLGQGRAPFAEIGGVEPVGVDPGGWLGAPEAEREGGVDDEAVTGRQPGGQLAHDRRDDGLGRGPVAVGAAADDGQFQQRRDVDFGGAQPVGAEPGTFAQPGEDVADGDGAGVVRRHTRSVLRPRAAVR
ncbi:Uncharacterised protein [Mycobacteroides abscessus subsp. abscessus]|nr:Uncharacterised protein [Mycobacteroides abscessus subsp. abscessus]